MTAIANYPKRFKSYVVSPTKICLQYEDVQVKLRCADGIKYFQWGDDSSPHLPISTHGTEVDIIAVGCQLPEVERAQLALLDAYGEYMKFHNKDYQREYGKDFLDFLYLMRGKLDVVISLTKHANEHLDAS
jgi:hypothetical protein